ncbi:MAG: U4/U6 small nuclear ribonucleoprotein prp4 [Watsoniomyces obsoletus]|nr:MAG: U4/U6 small nuclear ribonucleoprotein prp4 [Watsoniomyces obsoletus]
MWRILPRQARPHQLVIGNPTLIDTTYNGETLNQFPHVNQIQSPFAAAVAGIRQDEQAYRPPQAPVQPIEHVEHSYDPRPSSAVPTASSVYSQPTPDPQRHDGRFTKMQPTLPVQYEVSPPSSAGTPEPGQHRMFDSGTVSPLDTPTRDPGQQHFFHDPPRSDSVSHAPATANPESGNSRNMLGVPSDPTDRASVATRWDDFMKESLGSDSSRPPLPDMNGLNLHSASTSDESGPSRPTAGLSRKTSKTLGTIKAGVANNRLLLRLKGSHVEQLTIPSYNHNEVELKDDEIKPTLPLKVGRNSPARVVSPTAATTQMPTPPSSGRRSPGFRIGHDKPFTPMGGRVVSSGRPLDPVRATSAGASPLGYTPDVTPATATTRHPIYEHEPVSRFSDSTLATTAITFDTPPITPDPNMSFLAGSGFNTSSQDHRQQPSSPTLPTSNKPKAVARKPISSRMSGTSHISQMTPTYPASVAPSIASTAKNLPPSPEETESSDLITTLQAKLDNLQHRRTNLQRITTDMEKHLSPSANVDKAMRDSMKNTVEQWKAELDEIVRQQHEIGLRLHRAWRRREREECLDEPTGLWVRRITY